ncbi:MAG: HAMP domain-containing histidine kinase [Planctomycetes bacterium]|nr:HAMP domain-containing histidine kinase [Planctomycetota bacterium]
MKTKSNVSALLTNWPVEIAAKSAIPLAALGVAVDAVTWVDLNVSILYILPPVLAAAARKRRLLWGLTVVLLVASFVVYALQASPGMFSFHEPFFLNRVLAGLTLIVTTGLLHILILAAEELDAQAASLRQQNDRIEAINRELIASHEVIIQQNAELNSRWQAAEEASEGKSRFLASVSHDIRSPLQTISIIAEFIQQAKQAPAELPQLGQMLHTNAVFLRDLATDVLEMSALRAGPTELHSSTFNLNELLGEEHDRALPQAKAKRLQLIQDVPDGNVWLCTDRTKLARILDNIVTNAIKYTHAGTVTIRCSHALNGGIEIRVQDTGVGIATEDLERIFDEFAQLRALAGDRRQGCGLGLTICRRLAELIGGQITVQSQLGCGSTFTVQLPNSAVASQPALPH